MEREKGLSPTFNGGNCDTVGKKCGGVLTLRNYDAQAGQSDGASENKHHDIWVYRTVCALPEGEENDFIVPRE